MTISTRVQGQLFEVKAAPVAAATAEALRLIRLAPTSAKEGGVVVATACTSRVIRTWTRAEHERFLAGLELYPHGPWKQIADHVGTKTTRQTMAHAQKYRQKIARRRHQLQLQHTFQHQQPPSHIDIAPAVEPNAEEQDDDDEDGDAISVSSEESAAATLIAGDATASDPSSDEFFETEILPLLQQLEPLSTDVDVKNEDSEMGDLLVVEASF